MHLSKIEAFQIRVQYLAETLVWRSSGEEAHGSIFQLIRHPRTL